jgi:molybdopterin converting factor small subunit
MNWHSQHSLQLLLDLRCPVIPPGTDTSFLLRVVMERHPQLASILEACTMAINEEYLGDACILKNGDVVAIIPPISGG